ncbi:4Fe-4S binding protein [Geothrix sp. 21YS21S-4]|uniref:4Fe-4S binding protein n=1 Tax=Geothrix sp. 21YS21S-4 TaxID=3068889 RepID=UPI0027BA9E4F|nr:4Fe-4S binding protein [Geothrix sp. 21YS21S-4]
MAAFTHSLSFLSSHRTQVRRAVQVFFLAVTAYVGASFHFFLSALGRGDASLTKPGGVEAFLPISALLGLKRLLLTGRYDLIHPAGLTLLLVFLAISLVFKRGFCGYICPVGLVSEVVGFAGKDLPLPQWAARTLSALKYVLLAFFLYSIVWMMPLEAIDGFLNAPFNKVSDAKLMDFFTAPSTVTLVVLAVLAVLGYLVRNFWCRFLCPYGALMGLASLLSPFKVQRDAEACIDCLKCTRACPAGIQVHQAGTIHSPECIGCHDCVRVRANDRCLKTGRVDYRRLALALFCVFWAAVFLAMATGYWDSAVSSLEYRFWLERLRRLAH